MGMLQLKNDAIHDVKIGDRRVLFHVPTTGLFELDALSGAVLDLFKDNEPVTTEDVRACFDGKHSADDITQTIRDFLDLGIVADGLNKSPDAPPLKIDNYPLSTIILNVNTGCNLSCSYCYKEDLASPKDGLKMAFETACKSIDLLLREAALRDRVNVVFFGGEPLTNFDLIRRVVEYAEKKCLEENKIADFSLTTNATLLTPKIVGFLNTHKFGIAVSIDGPKTLHDKNRKTVGGKGTYDIVSDKVRMLLARYTARPVGARVTLTRGITEVVNIHRHLRETFGFYEVGFAPATSADISAFNLTTDELSEVFFQMKELGRLYLAAALRGENVGFGNLHQLMTDLHEGTRKSLPCGAGLGLLAVDAKGDLNLCHRFTGSTLPTFGNVDQGIDKPRLGALIEAAGKRAGTGCDTCRIQNICSSGCYHESYAKYGDPLHPTYHYCDHLRDWVDFGIEVYFTILKKNPDFFERHINPRIVAKDSTGQYAILSGQDAP